MNKLSVQVIASYGLVFGLMIALAIANNLNVNFLLESEAEVAHTHQVISQAATIE